MGDDLTEILPASVTGFAIRSPYSARKEMVAG